MLEEYRLRFIRVWRRLAKEGKCDGYGGADYKRVRGLFLLCGCPENVRKFICRHANDRSDQEQRN